TRQGVKGALAQAEAMRGQARWREAQKALEQAELLAGADSADDLRVQVKRARRDLGMAAELDRIRQAISTIVGENLDEASGPPAYMRAFRQYKLDLSAGDAKELAERIRATEIKQELVDALDHWAFLEPDEAIRVRLTAVAQAADPDPWRKLARDPILWK